MADRHHRTDKRGCSDDIYPPPPEREKDWFTTMREGDYVFTVGEDIAEATYRTAIAYLHSVEYPRYNDVHDEVFTDLTVQHQDLSSEDRVDMAMVDIDMFTEGFLRHLQREVLEPYSYSDWRIHIWADTRGHDIVVYSDRIEIGGTPPESEFSEALAQWRKAARRIREKTYGPRRRQFLEVKARMPNAVQCFEDRPFLVVGAFDNFRGDFDYDAIWWLEKGDGIYQYVPEVPGNPDAVAHGDDYAVDNSGRLGVVCKHYRDSPFQIVQWRLKTAPRHEIQINKRPEGNPSYPFTIEHEDIIRDVDLKKKESPC